MEGKILPFLFTYRTKNNYFRKKTKKVIYFFATTEIVIKFATPIKRDVL
jgi:membrane protease subunit (stomatin/prohibitin family)